MRAFSYVAAYIFGVGLGVIAAITGSIGPEPARTQMGKALAAVYLPYYEMVLMVCWPLGGFGFLIALILSGVPFVLLVWLLFYVYDKVVM
jgi:hypothetical protein